MATTREQLEQLQKQVRRLKIESAEMRRVLRAHGWLPSNGKRGAQKGKRGLSERERAIEILRGGGVTRGMTPAEKKLAAEWQALSKEERRHVEETLRGVRLDPPLSQLIHEMRG